MSRNEFRMSIDVTIRGHSDGKAVAPLISDALQELTNRRDFRFGLLRPGRAITHSIDFDAVQVTVDVTTLTTQELEQPARPA